MDNHAPSAQARAWMYAVFTHSSLAVRFQLTRIDCVSTLITRSAYLPGVVLLVHTLYKHRSNYPIVVQHTKSLEPDCVECLRQLTAQYPRLHTQLIEAVPLPDGLLPISPRFNDTLTKLRAFQPLDQAGEAPQPGLSRVPTEICFLDSDIMVFRNMDDVFEVRRPDSNHIAAHHACVCNRDSDPWAPLEWVPENCASTPVQHPEALTKPTPSSSKEVEKKTHELLNSGVFVCSPSEDLWRRMDEFRLTDPRVSKFTFPDQNFLDVFFKDRWMAFGWQFNALKTHRYWHPNMWRDDEVRALHYIVDKPWEARIAADGTAGYRGRDGVTHSWWWREYEAWEAWMAERGGEKALETVRRHVCVDSQLGASNFNK